jgi:hypothetical protein
VRNLRHELVHPAIPSSADIGRESELAKPRLDAEARTTPGGTAAIACDHPNFDSTKGTVTATDSQTTPPLFVDATAGDFREAASSPTVDAGSTTRRTGDRPAGRTARYPFLTCGVGGTTTISRTRRSPACVSITATRGTCVHARAPNRVSHRQRARPRSSPRAGRWCGRRRRQPAWRRRRAPRTSR